VSYSDVITVNVIDGIQTIFSEGLASLALSASSSCFLSCFPYSALFLHTPFSPPHLLLRLILLFFSYFPSSSSLPSSSLFPLLLILHLSTVYNIAIINYLSLITLLLIFI